MLKLAVLAFFLTLTSCSFIEQDPNIPDLLGFNFTNSGTYYPNDFIRKLYNECGPSLPLSYDSFNDPVVKEQLRKNVILIIDKMLTMQTTNMASIALDRLSDAKAIRAIYTNDKLFNNRQLPRYYHNTRPVAVPLILDSMYIKFSVAAYPGAWFATGFFSPKDPVFALGSELDLPLNEVTNRSHYIGSMPRLFFGLGRWNNVTLWKNGTDLIQWGVPSLYIENITNYITNNYDAEKTTFLLSRLVSLDQILLERQLLTVAHAYTNDRANALLAGSFGLVAPTFNSSNGNISIGQILFIEASQYVTFYGVVASFNVTKVGTIFKYLTLHATTRETTVARSYLTKGQTSLLNLWLPDVAIQDMNIVVQLIADGKLLNYPPPSTRNLRRSIKKLMTRVKPLAPEEQLETKTINTLG